MATFKRRSQRTIQRSRTSTCRTFLEANGAALRVDEVELYAVVMAPPRGVWTRAVGLAWAARRIELQAAVP